MCFFNNFHKWILNNISTHIIFIAKFFDLLTLCGLYSRMLYDLSIMGEAPISTSTQQRRYELCSKPLHPQSGFVVSQKAVLSRAEYMQTICHGWKHTHTMKGKLPCLVCSKSEETVANPDLYMTRCWDALLWLVTLKRRHLWLPHPCHHSGLFPLPSLLLFLCNKPTIKHNTWVRQPWSTTRCLGCCTSTERHIRCVLNSYVILCCCAFFPNFPRNADSC